MNTKPWLETYPQDVPSTIEECSNTIIDLFEESVKKYPNHSAFTCMGKTLTYKQIDELSDHFASYLLVDLQLPRSSTVALMMPNLLQYPIVMIGALKAGMVVTNINPLYTPHELKHQLSDSEATSIVIVENFVHTLAEIINQTNVKHTIITKLGDMLPFGKRHLVNFVVKQIKHMVPEYYIENAVDFNNALKKGKSSASFYSPIKETFPKANSHDIAFLQYTGGTTGVAKGAMLTHYNILSNVEQAHYWIRPVLKDGEETIITALPLYHIFSLMANCFVFMKIGGCNHLIVNPRDMKGFVKELKKTKFTAITGVNTLFNGLLRTKEFDEVDFSDLKIVLGGGMAVQRAVAEKWKDVTGVPIIEAYGLTEASPAICINPLTLEDYNGKIGLPLPSTQCAILNDDGEELPIGQRGELCVCGPQVMKGYWKNDEATNESIVNGWLHTGDIAVMDEHGYIEIVDRKKDMILVSGFNVFPNEVEEAISSHPSVKEVGVVGVPNENTGEAVKAVIVAEGAPPLARDIREHCKKYLTHYKIPKIIKFVEGLPKTGPGKVLRRELKDY